MDVTIISLQPKNSYRKADNSYITIKKQTGVNTSLYS